MLSNFLILIHTYTVTMTFLTCQNNPIYIYFKNNNIKIPKKNPGFHIEEVTTSGLAYMYA
jgi:hypothetical protein